MPRVFKRNLLSGLALGTVVGLATGSSEDPSPPYDDDGWGALEKSGVQPEETPEKEPQPKLLSLDDFYSGIEDGCSKNPTLATALDSMGTPTASYTAWKANRTMTVPRNLEKAFGEPFLAKSEGDFSVLSVKIREASYFGFPVTSMDRWAGHSNGINGFSFVVDAPYSEVQRAVTENLDITDSCSESSGGTGCLMGPFKLTIVKAMDNTTEIICDTSN